MKSVIVGTAGHIDHGKSALVRALTGTDPDRLPEEKRRGITIDLGFADLELNGLRLGFVDVPGHERFVKNMLAGAHGIDLVALVIAADEGVMPQTREHFDICRLLDVPGGLVIITKTDLVEPELIPLVTEEAEELVAGSFLEVAPIVTVSSKSRAGLEELKTVLMKLANQVRPRSSAFVAMLPVDRAFTMKGFGPVVTGTLISGSVGEGDELELLPERYKVRARGLQVHGKSVMRAVAGQRTAINLGNVETSSIERGMVLAPPNRLTPVQLLDVQLELLPSAPRALRSRARVRFHLHTAEVLGRVRVIDESGAIAPGGKGFVQLRLEAPVVAYADERFILRSYSPSLTIGGGKILNPFAAKHRGRDMAHVRQTLTSLAAGDRVAQFTIFVSEAGERGQRLVDIAARTAWNDQLLSDAARRSQDEGSIIDCEGVFISREEFIQLGQLVMEDVTLHHKKEPLARGLARETLRERRFVRSPVVVFRTVLRTLESQGLLVAEKDIVRAKEHTLELSAEDAALRNRIEQVFKEAALEPPSLESALKAVSSGAADINRVKKILQMSLDNGTVVRVQPDMVFHRNVLDDLIKKLGTYADSAPDRSIDVPRFKELAGVSRKYAIPLLEFLDREKITQRQGERRIIMQARK